MGGNLAGRRGDDDQRGGAPALGQRGTGRDRGGARSSGSRDGAACANGSALQHSRGWRRNSTAALATIPEEQALASRVRLPCGRRPAPSVGPETRAQRAPGVSMPTSHCTTGEPSAPRCRSVRFPSVQYRSNASMPSRPMAFGPRPIGCGTYDPAPLRRTPDRQHRSFTPDAVQHERTEAPHPPWPQAAVPRPANPGRRRRRRRAQSLSRRPRRRQRSRRHRVAGGSPEATGSATADGGR